MKYEIVRRMRATQDEVEDESRKVEKKRYKSDSSDRLRRSKKIANSSVRSTTTTDSTTVSQAELVISRQQQHNVYMIPGS